MNGAGDNLPYYAQAIALVATLFGAVVGVFSLIWAFVAARRAKGAREANQALSRGFAIHRHECKGE